MIYAICSKCFHISTLKELESETFTHKGIVSYSCPKCGGNNLGLMSGTKEKLSEVIQDMLDVEEIIQDMLDVEEITVSNKVNKETKIRDCDNCIKTLDLIYQYACIDGAHHKQWLIDQVVRNITGDKYDKWVHKYEFDETDENGNPEYEWEVGIPP